MISRVTLTILLLAAGAVTAKTTDPSKEGLRIATKAFDLSRGWKDYVVQLEMEIQLSGGNSTTKYLRLKNLENKSGDKSLVVFDRPADVQGTSLLTHAHLDKPNDQWLYLPEMRRTKRVTSDSRNKSFMGSEFTYDDMTFNDLNKYTYKLLKEEKCALGQCFVVEETPKDKESTYSRIVVWYDKSDYRTLKTDYFDAKNELLKQMDRTEYKKQGGKVWFPGQMKMHNVQTNKTTTLKFTDFRFGNGFAEKDFAPEILGRGN